MVSGGFDPLHVGHVRLLKAAYDYGNSPPNHVQVVLNSDAWLLRKKGYVFMNWRDRARILLAIKYVGFVFLPDDSDDTVRKTLASFQPDIFMNGGDRTKENTPENNVCLELGIKQVWGGGGNKIRSSQEIVDSANKQSLLGKILK